jgi:UDP-3-O-[3-hydroxymyristoyl] glucosamine N-acyltransferase
MLKYINYPKLKKASEGSLTFLANPKYVNFIYILHEATITIVNKSFEPEQEISTTLIKVEDAYKSFSKLLEYYNQVKLMKSGIEQPSVISENVTYGERFIFRKFLLHW